MQIIQKVILKLLFSFVKVGGRHRPQHVFYGQKNVFFGHNAAIHAVLGAVMVKLLFSNVPPDPLNPPIGSQVEF